MLGHFKDLASYYKTSGGGAGGGGGGREEGKENSGFDRNHIASLSILSAKSAISDELLPTFRFKRDNQYSILQSFFSGSPERHH